MYITQLRPECPCNRASGPAGPNPDRWVAWAAFGKGSRGCTLTARLERRPADRRVSARGAVPSRSPSVPYAPRGRSSIPRVDCSQVIGRARPASILRYRIRRVVLCLAPALPLCKGVVSVRRVFQPRIIMEKNLYPITEGRNICLIFEPWSTLKSF